VLRTGEGAERRAFQEAGGDLRGRRAKEADYIRLLRYVTHAALTTMRGGAAHVVNSSDDFVATARGFPAATAAQSPLTVKPSCAAMSSKRAPGGFVEPDAGAVSADVNDALFARELGTGVLNVVRARCGGMATRLPLAGALSKSRITRYGKFGAASLYPCRVLLS